MDYSTISNKTTFTEVGDITDGELTERYYSLKKQYDNLSSSYEATKQELHDTRRGYQTALDVQRHLTAELENLQADEEKRTGELNSRIVSLQEEISDLRQERLEETESHDNEIKKLKVEIKRLKDDQACKIKAVSPERNSVDLEEARAACAAAIADADAAKKALEEARAETLSLRLQTEELVSKMAEMHEEVEFRREELKAAAKRETDALADLAEARALLHQSTDSPDLQPHAAKGNSIFAEVEDKRQEMAKNLIQMKQTNARLRRELANKQAEVEALVHEKHTVWEQQAGTAAHYDRELLESYEERITQLEGMCERQRREIAHWYGKFCDPTAQSWLPGVLENFKSECERLRQEVLSRGATQLANAVQIRELRRKLAVLTVNGTKTVVSSAIDADDKFEDSIPSVQLPVTRPMLDDVKKKVSFN